MPGHPIPALLGAWRLGGSPFVANRRKVRISNAIALAFTSCRRPGRMTRIAAGASMFRAVGISRGPWLGFWRALPRSGWPTGTAGRVCAPADTVAARR